MRRCAATFVRNQPASGKDHALEIISWIFLARAPVTLDGDDATAYQSRIDLKS